VDPPSLVAASTSHIKTLTTKSQRDYRGVGYTCRRGPKRRKKDKRGGSGKPSGKRKTRGMVAEKRRPRNFAALLEEVGSMNCDPSHVLSADITALLNC